VPDDERCEVCGHLLTEWTPPPAGRGERVAMWVASHVASWWFAATLVLAIAVWVTWNVTAHPFEPYPVIIFAVISAVLGSLAALQAPLILMTQRRMAERDRQRDEQTLRIAARSEGDIHRVEAALDALARRLGQ
jgi:uncharacterized membrane protein